MDNTFLESVKKQFRQYKALGEKAMDQTPDAKLSWQYNEESNSMVTIVKHLWGNMLSRWTDFLTSDGEKPWRKRDEEFENESISREALLTKWEQGWTCLFDALEKLEPGDLQKIVYIRSESLTVQDAIIRQLAHYSYHVGQIVFIAKISAESWDTLSIPRERSKQH